jgi:hypothetical protein
VHGLLRVFCGVELIKELEIKVKKGFRLELQKVELEQAQQTE